jgi:hypothetical protein
MGILYENNVLDTDLIFTICEVHAEHWNRKYAEEYGILLGIHREAVEAISIAGGNMLERSFPKDDGTPSAFKRAATLLVMMCIHPFIVARQRDENGLFCKPVVVGDSLRDLAVRFMADTLPLVFSVLVTDVNGEWVPLDNWKGFSSEDFETEFITFLKWLGNSDCVQHSLGNPVYNDERLTRIILGTSLILEASYGPIVL